MFRTINAHDVSFDGCLQYYSSATTIRQLIEQLVERLIDDIFDNDLISLSNLSFFISLKVSFGLLVGQIF